MPIYELSFNNIINILYIQIICPLTAYYDENLGKCVQSKGNGQLLKVNDGMKCKSNYVGILPHYKNSKFYYVCKKNSVLMFKCAKKEYFNKMS